MLCYVPGSRSRDHTVVRRYCFFLKHTSEVQDVLVDFVVHAKNVEHNIKEILSANGGEFDNEPVRQTLRKHGIFQRLTAPYSPAQNGSSDRDNQTIVEMPRTLKYSNQEIDFPKYLFAEFVNTSVYVLNGTDKSSISGSSTYELWMGKKEFQAASFKSYCFSSQHGIFHNVNTCVVSD
ncbi:hypothetical protein AVEN_232780-1 [Araneus ventricosus]|uniref:Integrase catalytic domain-containing protein n=1 Tax=Araneus ventricosus TaxID=182803 RepID=A0A4Y2QSF8_ARAVE|nr:hypothetical protein AVEN_232780-1 [Araneus ventricosus]